MRWTELQGQLVGIKDELSRAGKGPSRESLERRLADIRGELARIESEWHESGGGRDHRTTIDELLDELLGHEGAEERIGPPTPDPDIVEEATVTARRRLGRRRADRASQRPTDREEGTPRLHPDSGGPVPPSQPGWRLIGAFVLALVVGVAGGLLVRSAVQDDQPASATVAPEPADQVGGMRELPASGPSESAASAGAEPEPQPALQRDLDRLLTLTPIVFDRGQRELGALDQRILNSVAAVLLAYPDAKVTVVGLADDSAPSAENLDLATGRAEAALGYFVSQGVPNGRLVAEGHEGSPPEDSRSQIALDVTLE
jgi:outer membrane protein OmpA-like peptidoglycan-associated protein